VVAVVSFLTQKCCKLDIFCNYWPYPCYMLDVGLGQEWRFIAALLYSFPLVVVLMLIIPFSM